jgi:hypothetical protein
MAKNARGVRLPEADDVGWRMHTCIESVIPNGYLRRLRHELRGVKTILDVGSGSTSPVAQAVRNDQVRVVHLDIQGFKSVHREGALGSRDRLRADARKLPIRPKAVEAVVALDFIEHLSREEGMTFLADAERIARKLVVVVTPNGFLPQTDAGDDPFDTHRSGWRVDDFRKLGFRVVGVRGLRALRGVRAKPVIRPDPLGYLLSYASDLVGIAANRPEHAFQLLCTKRLVP